MNVAADGDVYYTIVLNSFIHLVMYSYYACTSVFSTARVSSAFCDDEPPLSCSHRLISCPPCVHRAVGVKVPTPIKRAVTHAQRIQFVSMVAQVSARHH